MDLEYSPHTPPLVSSTKNNLSDFNEALSALTDASFEDILDEFFSKELARSPGSTDQLQNLAGESVDQIHEPSSLKQHSPSPKRSLPFSPSPRPVMPFSFSNHISPFSAGAPIRTQPATQSFPSTLSSTFNRTPPRAHLSNEGISIPVLHQPTFTPPLSHSLSIGPVTISSQGSATHSTTVQTPIQRQQQLSGLTGPFTSALNPLIPSQNKNWEFVSPPSPLMRGLHQPFNSAIPSNEISPPQACKSPPLYMLVKPRRSWLAQPPTPPLTTDRRSEPSGGNADPRISLSAIPPQAKKHEEVTLAGSKRWSPDSGFNEDVPTKSVQVKAEPQTFALNAATLPAHLENMLSSNCISTLLQPSAALRSTTPRRINEPFAGERFSELEEVHPLLTWQGSPEKNDDSAPFPGTLAHTERENPVKSRLIMPGNAKLEHDYLLKETTPLNGEEAKLGAEDDSWLEKGNLTPKEEGREEASKDDRLRGSGGMIGETQSISKSIKEKRRRERVSNAFAALRKAVGGYGDMASVVSQAVDLIQSQKGMIESLKNQLLLHRMAQEIYG